MGGLMILDMDGREGVQDVRYYSPGQTNFEAESFAIRDTL